MSAFLRLADRLFGEVRGPPAECAEAAVECRMTAYGRNGGRLSLLQRKRFEGRSARIRRKPAAAPFTSFQRCESNPSAQDA